MRASSRTLLALALGCCCALGAPAAAEVAPGRYSIDDQGTETRSDDIVTDNGTGLVWQREVPNTPSGCPDTSCNNAQAVAYCNGLQIANGGWRLPKISELMTIIDTTTFGQAIDGVVFPNTPADFFWSVTRAVRDSNYAWTVYFVDGTSDYVPRINYARVRCVR